MFCFLLSGKQANAHGEIFNSPLFLNSPLPLLLSLSPALHFIANAVCFCFCRSGDRFNIPIIVLIKIAPVIQLF